MTRETIQLQAPNNFTLFEPIR